MAKASNTQAANLTFAWLGALLALVNCVDHNVSAHTHFAYIRGMAVTVGIAIVLVALLRQEQPSWALRAALCFALGSSCSIITVLAIS